MKKNLQFCLLFLLTISLLFLSACGWYHETEDGIWSYYILTEKDRPDNPERVGTVALVTLLNLEAVADENGTILIPYEIDGYQVSELGDIGSGFTPFERNSRRFYYGEPTIERIIIPAEINIINTCFFKYLNAKYVEFLSEEPYISIVEGFNSDTIWIVPNGAKETFFNNVNIIGYRSGVIDKLTIIEKWEIDGNLED